MFPSHDSYCIETRLDKLEEIERPDFDKNYEFSLKGAPHASKLLVLVKEISKSYDKRVVLSDINFEIRGNIHIHVKGLNGSGKSTLLHILAKQLAPSNGTVTYGDNVTAGYFSQDTEGLNYKISALDNLSITEAKQEVIYRQARSLGITAEDLLKMPGELSRGQQSKLGFAKLLLANHDLIILDEPTNHLDIATKEQLEKALRNYEGAVLVASHDVYFLQQLKINQTLELKNGRIIES